MRHNPLPSRCSRRKDTSSVLAKTLAHPKGLKSQSNLAANSLCPLGSPDLGVLSATIDPVLSSPTGSAHLSRKTAICSCLPISRCWRPCLDACMPSRPPILHDFSIYPTAFRSTPPGQTPTWAVDFRNMPLPAFPTLPVFVMPI
jgi:hypothetical protein